MLTHSPIYFVASNFCNSHVLKYTPVAKVIAPCIWANLHSIPVSNTMCPLILLFSCLYLNTHHNTGLCEIPGC